MEYNAGQIVLMAAGAAFAVAVQLGFGAWIYSIFNNKED